MAVDLLYRNPPVVVNHPLRNPRDDEDGICSNPKEVDPRVRMDNVSITWRNHYRVL